jgi:hypothetical protein
MPVKRLAGALPRRGIAGVERQMDLCYIIFLWQAGLAYSSMTAPPNQGSTGGFKYQRRGNFDEKDLSAKQHQAEKDARIRRTDEHPRGAKRLETEAGKGKKEAYGLNLLLQKTGII